MIIYQPEGSVIILGPVGMILAEITGSNPAAGSGRYYAHDNIQSTRGVFDDSAGSLGWFEYTPFGSGFASGGPADVTHRYTGLDLDPLTGQYYAPYRYYDATTARWLTRDPLGMVDGPNVYGYVMGGPTRARDRLGLTRAAIFSDDDEEEEGTWDCVLDKFNTCASWLNFAITVAEAVCLLTCVMTGGVGCIVCVLGYPLAVIGAAFFCAGYALSKCDVIKDHLSCPT